MEEIDNSTAKLQARRMNNVCQYVYWDGTGEKRTVHVPYPENAESKQYGAFSAR